MASFDFIDAAGYGYRDLWRHRRYLAHLSFAPFLIQIACLLGQTQAGMKGNIALREGLIMLPAIFSQGWMLSHYVRFLFLDQRWPFRPTGNGAADRATLEGRLRGISVGTLLYTLPQFLLYGFFQIAIALANRVTPAGTVISTTTSVAKNAAAIAHGPPPPASPALSVAVLVAACIALWSIRLLCLYVPGALNIPIRSILRRLGGFQFSFCLFSTILVSTVPPNVMVGLFLMALNKWARPGIASGTATIIVDSAAQIIADFVMTGGIAYGLRIVLGPRSGSAKTGQ